jgi:hypothetical protein
LVLFAFGDPLVLVDLLGERFEPLGAASHFLRRPRAAFSPEGVAGLHLSEVRVQPLQVALLVLELGERELPLAPLALYLFPETLGLIDDLLVLLVTGRVEPGHDSLVPILRGRGGLQYAGLAPVPLDAPGDPVVGGAILLREGQKAHCVLQRENTKPPNLAPYGGARR